MSKLSVSTVSTVSTDEIIEEDGTTNLVPIMEIVVEETFTETKFVATKPNITTNSWLPLLPLDFELDVCDRSTLAIEVEFLGKQPSKQ